MLYTGKTWTPVAFKHLDHQLCGTQSPQLSNEHPHSVIAHQKHCFHGMSRNEMDVIDRA